MRRRASIAAPSDGPPSLAEGACAPARTTGATLGRLVIATVLFLLATSAVSAKESTESVSKEAPEVFVKLLGGGAEDYPKDYKATDTKYFLYVPDDYDQKRAYPMILSISPGNDGAQMFQSWKKAAPKYKIIFACPHDAGNETPVSKRGQMAVDTMFDVRSKYNIAPDQMYITGFSGGGRMSTHMVMAFPGTFAGHIPICGIAVGSIAELAKLKTKNGHYIFTGETDFNRKESEEAKAALERAKIPVELMVAPGVAHTTPNADQGLTIYDWFLARAEATLKPKLEAAERAEGAGKLAEALKLYEELAALGSDSEVVKKAQAKADEFRERRAKCVENAKAEPSPAALEELKNIAQGFAGTSVGKEAAELHAALLKDPRTAEVAARLKKEGLAAEAQKLLDKAGELEKAGSVLQAFETYKSVVKKYADTPAREAAEKEIARLESDPAFVKEKQETEAAGRLQYAENMLRNGMKDKAKQVFNEIVQKYPDTEAAAKAKQRLAELK